MAAVLNNRTLQEMKAFYESHGTGTDRFWNNQLATEEWLKDLRGCNRYEYDLQPLSLVKWMTQCEPQDRPTAHQLVKNISEWCSSMEYFGHCCDTSDITETTCQDPSVCLEPPVLSQADGWSPTAFDGGIGLGSCPAGKESIPVEDNLDDSKTPLCGPDVKPERIVDDYALADQTMLTSRSNTEDDSVNCEVPEDDTISLQLAELAEELSTSDGESEDNALSACRPDVTEEYLCMESDSTESTTSTCPPAITEQRPPLGDVPNEITVSVCLSAVPKNRISTDDASDEGPAPHLQPEVTGNSTSTEILIEDKLATSPSGDLEMEDDREISLPTPTVTRPSQPRIDRSFETNPTTFFGMTGCSDLALRDRSTTIISRQARTDFLGLRNA